MQQKADELNAQLTAAQKEKEQLKSKMVALQAATTEEQEKASSDSNRKALSLVKMVRILNLESRSLAVLEQYHQHTSANECLMSTV